MIHFHKQWNIKFPMRVTIGLHVNSVVIND